MPLFYAKRAAAYQSLKKLGQAMRDLDSALEADGNYSTGYLHRGKLHRCVLTGNRWFSSWCGAQAATGTCIPLAGTWGVGAGGVAGLPCLRHLSSASCLHQLSSAPALRYLSIAPCLHRPSNAGVRGALRSAPNTCLLLCLMSDRCCAGRCAAWTMPSRISRA